MQLNAWIAVAGGGVDIRHNVTLFVTLCIKWFGQLKCIGVGLAYMVVRSQG